MDFTALRDGFYPNIMQTDDGNSGVRIELAGKDLMVMAGKGNGQNFLIPLGEIEFGKEYHLEIEALDRSYVFAKLGNHPWQSIVDSSVRLPGANFRVGDGHVQTRRWQGNISNFKMQVDSTLSWRFGIGIVLALVLLLAFPLALIFRAHRQLILTAIRLTVEGAVQRGPTLRLPSIPSTFPLAWLSLAPIGVTALYAASYAFVYFPITEGWFHVYVDAFKRNIFMYRDVNLLIPPIYPMTLIVFDRIFGDGFWALRLLGIVVIAAIAVTTFDLLRFIFDRWVSAFAAIVAAIYYQFGNAYIGYDFTQFATLYMLLGCLGVVRYARSGNAIFLFASGFFLAIATLSKQSNAGIVSIGMTFVALFAIYYVSKTSILKHSILFFSGALAPLIAVLIWLARNEALFAFLDQTAFHAASAKGNSAIASGWIRQLFFQADFAGANLAAAIFVARTVISALILVLCFSAAKSAFVAVNSRSKHPAKVFAHSFLGAASSQPRNWNPRAVASILGFILISLTVIAHRLKIEFEIPLVSLPKSYELNFLFIVIAFNVYCIGIIVALIRIRRRHITRTLSLLIVSAFGLLLMIGNGTSAGLSEISAFLGIGILIASGMSVTSRSAIMPIFVMLLAVHACGAFAATKFANPYSWWGISTGEIGASTCSPMSGRLSGLCIDEHNATGIAATVAAVSSSTTPSGEVLGFPNIPIFTLLADRKPFGRSPIPWFDFMSQDEGRLLLKQLQETPPEAIVVARVPDFAYDSHEQLFNAGAPGVHRQILQYIDELWKQHQIDLVTENVIDGVNVQVFRYAHGAQGR
ncbi:glycosyltransferase family 39 protein [Rhizobium sp. A22-96]